MAIVDESCSELEKKKYANMSNVKIEAWLESGAAVEKSRGSADVGIHKPVPEKAVKGAAVDLWKDLRLTRSLTQCSSSNIEAKEYHATDEKTQH